MDYFERLEHELDLPEAEKEQVIRELKTHFGEIKAESLASGMDETRAEEEAERRLGQPDEIASQRTALPGTWSWKSALIAAVPFFGATVILAFQIGKQAFFGAGGIPALLALLLFAVVMTAGSVRELRVNRRPLWLATWLPAGLMSISRVVQATAGLIGMPLTPWAALVMFVVGFGPSVAVALWASWNEPKWRNTVMLVCFGLLGLAYCTGHLAAQQSVVVSVWWLLPYELAAAILGGAVWLAIAIRLFAAHPRASSLHASLFMFAALSLNLGRYSSSASASAVVNQLSPALVGVVAVFLFVRAPNWKLKIWSLAAAVVLQNSVRYLSPYLGWPIVSVSASWDSFVVALDTVRTITSLLLVLMPVVLELRWFTGRPAAVQ